MNDREIDELLKGAKAPQGPGAETLGRIAESITGSMRPVRLLPPQWMLAGGVALICAVVALAGAAAMGFSGIAKMSVLERGTVFSALGILVLAAASELVSAMIPGSRRRFSSPVLLMVTSLGLAAVLALCFRDYRTTHFVHAGLVCLGMGVMHAIPAGLLSWLVLRRGFAVDAVSAGLAAGTLAGLAGVSMLELHCMPQSRTIRRIDGQLKVDRIGRWRHRKHWAPNGRRGVAAGDVVRALVRSVDKARQLPREAQPVIEDLTRPETLRDAADGIDAVVFTHGSDGADKVGSETVDYGGVHHVLFALGSRTARIALMTAIGVTNRTGSYNRSTESHDWKRRAERLVRISGLPYTIVRPGWFDYNKPDEHRLVFVQGDTRQAGNSSDGVIARRQIAEVLVSSLVSSEALRKTFELVATKGPAQDDFDPLLPRLIQICKAYWMEYVTRQTSPLKRSPRGSVTTCKRWHRIGLA